MPPFQVNAQQVFARIALETGLAGDAYLKKRSPTTLVTALCGIRGDHLETAHLALAARLPQYRPESLMRALQERHTLVRTWGARGLLQVIPTAELGTYLAAAGITAPRWRRFLDARSNLTTPARLRLLRRLCPEVLSREALKGAIPDGTTRLFMLREAAQSGHILWQDGDGQHATYIWTKKSLGKPPEIPREYHDLVERYLMSYGPVQAADLASWLGVTVAAARKLMAKHRVEEVQVEGEDLTTFMRPDELESLRRTRKGKVKGTIIVPPGDPLLTAYKTRYQIESEGGEEPGLAFVDGRPVAVWTLVKDTVTVRLLEDGPRQTIVKKIEDLVSRAGIQAKISEEVAT